MTAHHKGLAKRQVVAPPVTAASRQTSKHIRFPGGNTISHDRPPYLTIAPPNGLKVMGGSD